MQRADSLEKSLWWEGLGVAGEGDDRGWDGWMASLTRWTWVWVNSGSWWWTGRPGVLQFMGSQRVRHDWGTKLNWTELEWKSRKSRDTWSNRQIWPWNTKWSRAMTNRVLPRKCTGHSKHPFPTTQEKTLHMDITRWSILKSDWLYSLQPKMEKLYTASKNKTRSWLWRMSWAPYCQIQT